MSRRDQRIPSGRFDRMGRPIYEMPADVKLMGRVSKSPGCWEWTGPVNNKGYGHANAFGEKYAHRASYVMHFGPVPAGMFVCHRCDNPRCVNPAHLFLGSNQDNVDDMVSKGRNAINSGERNGRSKLTDEQARQMRAEYDAGSTIAVLARRYGLAKNTVRRRIRLLDPETLLPVDRCPCRTPLGVTA